MCFSLYNFLVFYFFPVKNLGLLSNSFLSENTWKDTVVTAGEGEDQIWWLCSPVHVHGAVGVGGGSTGKDLL